MRKIFKFKKVFFMFAVIYVCCIFISQQVTIKRQKEELKIYYKENQKVEEEAQLLQDKFKMSENGKYVERLAREKLGFVKEGEVVIIDNSEDNKEQNKGEKQRNNKEENKREQ